MSIDEDPAPHAWAEPMTREEALEMFGSDPDLEVPADVPPRGAAR